jgi:hypothetical protein
VESSIHAIITLYNRQSLTDRIIGNDMTVSRFGVENFKQAYEMCIISCKAILFQETVNTKSVTGERDVSKCRIILYFQTSLNLLPN